MEEVFTWPGYRQPKDQDIAEANRLLDEVFGNGVRPAVLECLARNDQTSINTCLYTGAMLEKHLGMSLKLRLYDAATVTSQYAACNWTLGVITLPGWTTFRTPTTASSSITPSCPVLSVWGVLTPSDAVERELDPVERAKLSRKGEYLLLNEMIVAAGMEWQNLWYGGQPWLKGLKVGDQSVT